MHLRDLLNPLDVLDFLRKKELESQCWTYFIYFWCVSAPNATLNTHTQVPVVVFVVRRSGCHLWAWHLESELRAMWPQVSMTSLTVQLRTQRICKSYRSEMIIVMGIAAFSNRFELLERFLY